MLPASAPVSVSQAPMVWHEQLAPGSFNLPALVRRYQGPLDVDAVRWAVAELRRRHEPLRTTFEIVDGAALQVVHPAEGDTTLAVVDLSGEPAGGPAAVNQLLTDASTRPFDLAAGPLFEPRLVRLGPDDHLLVVRLHHTTFDDWSVDVFRRELSAHYAARHASVPSPLAEPPLTFSEFARRERARLDGGEGAAQLAWWRRELDGAPLAVQLPLGPASPGGTDPIRVDLDPALVAALRAVATRLRATPYMTALAAFSALVAHDTGLDDLVVASVVAHRNRTELEPLIGCFTKKIPVRLRVDGDPTFAELVARARTALLGALAHQDVGFDEALEAALGAGASAHGVVPQVNVVFQAETPRHATLSLPGVTISAYDPPVEARRERHFTAARSDDVARRADRPEWGDGAYLGTFLIVSLADSGDRMTFIARGSFDRDAASRWLARLVDLLRAAVADPARSWSELVPDEPCTKAGDGDVLNLRGFRVRRSHLEGALADCPGVRDVAVEVRREAGWDAQLVASIVPVDPASRPSLGALRAGLWSKFPGVPWPAAALPAPDAREAVDTPIPLASTLTAMWQARSRCAVKATDSYRHDFSFLAALADARAAGIPIPDGLVARCRTPESLAVALAATR